MPAARRFAPLVAIGDEILMFGGVGSAAGSGATRFTDVWRYDSATGGWWDLRAEGGPPGRVGAAAAYDAASGLVVLFGGAVGPCDYPFCPEVVGDTWVFDPVSIEWEQRSPSESPSPRHGHGMVYDAGSDRIVLFGGDTGQRWMGDTWVYDVDADTWSEVPTTDAPWPVAQVAMAADASGERIVLWGGADREDEEVWTFDAGAAAWERSAPEPAPEPAWDACLAWVAGRMILTGGEGPTTVEIAEGVTSREIRVRDEVWAFDPGSRVWTPLEPLPAPMSGHGCAADPASGSVVVWDGGRMLTLDPLTGRASPAAGG
jgi:N-acetylneuraminic acid mutarotase